jgi:hypothetical protein
MNQTGPGRPLASDKERCCYMMVDSAMVASQNGFCSSYKLSYKKKQYFADYDKKYYFFLLI